MAEGHAGEGGQEVGAHARSHHFLDHDAHLLVDVDQPALGAVLDRVGAEGGGVDLGDGVGQGGQPLLLRPGVGQEEALVLAGEGGAVAVLQQAGAAHDDRPPLEVVQHHGEPVQDLAGEPRVLEELDDVRILLPDLVDVDVLLVVHVLQAVVADEVEHAVGGDVPGLGALDAPEGRVALPDLPQDGHGQEEPGRLAAQLAVALRREDGAVDEGEEIVDAHESLGGVDELDLVGEEGVDERDEHALLDGRRQLDHLRAHGAVLLEGVSHLDQRGVAALDGVDQEARLVLLDPGLDEVDDLVLAEVVRGDAEGLVGDPQRVVELGPLQRLVLFAGGLGARAGPAGKEPWRSRIASSTPFQARWFAIFRAMRRSSTWSVRLRKSRMMSQGASSAGPWVRRAVSSPAIASRRSRWTRKSPIRSAMLLIRRRSSLRNGPSSAFGSVWV